MTASERRPLPLYPRNLGCFSGLCGGSKIFFVFEKKFMAIPLMLVQDNGRTGEVKLPSIQLTTLENHANSKRQFADHRDGAA